MSKISTMFDSTQLHDDFVTADFDKQGLIANEISYHQALQESAEQCDTRAESAKALARRILGDMVDADPGNVAEFVDSVVNAAVAAMQAQQYRQLKMR